jgi:hypothetical protein
LYESDNHAEGAFYLKCYMSADYIETRAAVAPGRCPDVRRKPMLMPR